MRALSCCVRGGLWFRLCGCWGGFAETVARGIASGGRLGEPSLPCMGRVSLALVCESFALKRVGGMWYCFGFTL